MRKREQKRRGKNKKKNNGREEDADGNKWAVQKQFSHSPEWEEMEAGEE